MATETPQPSASPFTFMRITADTDCTFRCGKCNPEGVHDPVMMPTGEVLETVRAGAALGINTVHLIGGEPSKRPDIVDLVAGMRQEGMTTIEMTTNGVPFYRLAEQLKEAGLTGVNISLDSFKPDKFRELTGVNALPFVLTAVEKARKLFEKVAINMVVMRKNVDEIQDFVEFSRQTGVMVRFCELTPHGPFMETNPHFFDENHVPREEIVRTLQAIAPVGNGNKSDIDTQNAHSEYVNLGGEYGGMRVGLITQYSNGWPCPKTECARLRIGPTSANSCIEYPDHNLMGLPYEEKLSVLQQLVEERRELETNGFPQEHNPKDSYPLYRFGLRRQSGSLSLPATATD